MTRIHLLSLTLGTLVACGVDDPPREGGQSGSLVPELCVEVDRIAVTDPSAVQPEAGHSLQDVLDEMEGTFVGTWGTQEITLAIVAAGGADLVIIEPEEPDPSLGEPGMGADPAPPETMCPAFQWEIPASLGVTSLPELDELGDTTLVAYGPDRGSIGYTLDVSEVTGTAQPDWDPADWDHTTLDISAGYDTDSWRGGLSWSSSDEPDASGMGSGMVAPVEEFTATAP